KRTGAGRSLSPLMKSDSSRVSGSTNWAYSDTAPHPFLLFLLRLLLLSAVQETPAMLRPRKTCRLPARHRIRRLVHRPRTRVGVRVRVRVGFQRGYVRRRPNELWIAT